MATTPFVLQQQPSTADKYSRLRSMLGLMLGHSGDAQEAPPQMLAQKGVLQRNPITGNVSLSGPMDENPASDTPQSPISTMSPWQRLAQRFADTKDLTQLQPSTMPVATEAQELHDLFDPWQASNLDDDHPYERVRQMIGANPHPGSITGDPTTPAPMGNLEFANIVGRAAPSMPVVPYQHSATLPSIAPTDLELANQIGQALVPAPHPSAFFSDDFAYSHPRVAAMLDGALVGAASSTPNDPFSGLRGLMAYHQAQRAALDDLPAQRLQTGMSLVNWINKARASQTAEDLKYQNTQSEIAARAATARAAGDFTLGPGQVRYNTEGAQIASGGPPDETKGSDFDSLVIRTEQGLGRQLTADEYQQLHTKWAATEGGAFDAQIIKGLTDPNTPPAQKAILQQQFDKLTQLRSAPSLIRQEAAPETTFDMSTGQFVKARAEDMMQHPERFSAAPPSLVAGSVSKQKMMQDLQQSINRLESHASFIDKMSPTERGILARAEQASSGGMIGTNLTAAMKKQLSPEAITYLADLDAARETMYSLRRALGGVGQGTQRQFDLMLDSLGGLTTASSAELKHRIANQRQLARVLEGGIPNFVPIVGAPPNAQPSATNFPAAYGGGQVPTQYTNPPSSSSNGPAVGTVKTFPNGNKGRWDGTGWELVH